MKTRIAVLLGGVAALTAVVAAQAAPAVQTANEMMPAAQNYADLLTPIPNATAALRADDAARTAAPPARLQLARFHHHHHHHGGFFPGAIIGGIIGGALAGSDFDDYDDAPPPPAYYYGPPPAAVAYCERHFRSYDPRTGTYLGYDGYRHPCP